MSLESQLSRFDYCRVYLHMDFLLFFCRYNLDMKMAAEIEELDLVVGGHSHTFLYTGLGYMS